MDNFLFTVLCLVFFTYIASRIANYAERTRRKDLYSQVVKEAIRQAEQKKRIDELYGRNTE